MYRTLILLAALVASAPAMAQGRDVPGDERAGTASAQFLLVPTTARTTSLANGLTAGLSSLSGLESLQSNPAALMANDGTEAMFSYINFVADVGVNTFGVAQSFGTSNIALFVTSWDLGEIPMTSAASPDPTSVTYDAATYVVGATYARQFTDRISAGITAKAVGETIDDVNGSAVAFDAGMTYTVGESGLQFGVSLRNFGTKMSYSGNGIGQSNPVDGAGGNGSFPIEIGTDSYELPSLLNFGATYTRQFAGDVSVTALGNFRSNAYDQPEFAGGLELGYGDLVYARGGVNLTPDQDVNAAEFWSIGGGVNVPLASSGIGVDYAFRSMGDLGNVNLVTAALRF
ncbi:PorV/PorQ family protein [Rubrivirga sp. IMCC45206]|uniref:PorV/PorQ family protein n=1 Tax=Rubrivirga sp. IMCC45206 TaxID=3391614 RepID=UPI00398FF090